ncbi:MAG: flagellar motor switch protein FliN [Bdellovibrio sp.]|nr:flagellar motor switch protein FliN [Bdellovibrio sp.]
MAREEVLEKSSDLSWLYNVPMKVSVELGQGRLTIRDLLLLGQGSVLELEKLAGEPLEVLVNDRLVSRGEVVMVNDKYGIRLTDVISPDDKQDEK